MPLGIPVEPEVYNKSAVSESFDSGNTEISRGSCSLISSTAASSIIKGASQFKQIYFTLSWGKEVPIGTAICPESQIPHTQAAYSMEALSLTGIKHLSESPFVYIHEAAFFINSEKVL